MCTASSYLSRKYIPILPVHTIVSLVSGRSALHYQPCASGGASDLT
jgi:hypothetical protein